MGTAGPPESPGASDRPERVLILDGPDTEPFDDPCLNHLVADRPASTDVVLVTVTDSWKSRVQALRARLGEEPARVGVVSVDEQPRSGASTGAAHAERLSVTPVGSPGDLTGLGIAITEYLSAWAGDGNRTVVCIHSLTALLQSVSSERAFEFLNALMSRTESAGVAIHVHMNPAAHDERTFQTVSTLFDRVVDSRGRDAGRAPAAASTGSAGDVEPDDGPAEPSVSDPQTQPSSSANGDGPDGGGRRVLAAVIVLVAVLAIVGVSFTSGGSIFAGSGGETAPDGGEDAALADATATPTTDPGSVAAAGTTTATPIDTASVKPTPSPTPTDTTAGTERTATPTRTATATPTRTATATPDPTPTATDGLLGNITDDDGLL